MALNWLFPDLNFFYSAQCLMVRRWRLIGYFPILYNPRRVRVSAGSRRASSKASPPHCAHLNERGGALCLHCATALRLLSAVVHCPRTPVASLRCGESWKGKGFSWSASPAAPSLTPVSTSLARTSPCAHLPQLLACVVRHLQRRLRQEVAPRETRSSPAAPARHLRTPSLRHHPTFICSATSWRATRAFGSLGG